MKVFKFGGSSVGSPAGMARVADLIDDGQPKVVVLSAIAGMTNALESIAQQLRHHRPEAALQASRQIAIRYRDFLAELFRGEAFRHLAQQAVDQSRQVIHAHIEAQDGSPRAQREILAQGELVSTRLFQLFLRERDTEAELLHAPDFMRIDETGEPVLAFTRNALPPLLEPGPSPKYFITQGYICRNARGEMDNLQRGGSDYTATLIGAALQAEEIQIWTDIDGLHNNDPRIVAHTRPVRQLSYREAAELAYFGAKILHPTCVIPAERERIPLRLKNTFQPEAPGTRISRQASGSGIAAIAAKDDITAIVIRSSRMLNAYGFLRRVFQVFEDFRTPIDLITTSEVAVSLTIDNDSKLDDILQALAAFGQVQAEGGQTIICLVGDQLGQRKGFAKLIFSALEHIPIRAVSYGGSDNNVSVLVRAEHKAEALRALNLALFPEIHPTT